MHHHLKNVALLISELHAYGIRHVVISPGSRNAPITILFSSDSAFNTHVIVDERSAAFFALGMAQQKNETVAMVCTSGSASLNYAPAIAEAYYQQIKLLVLTADRPLAWLDHAEGQQINQTNIYQNYCSASYTFDTNTKDELLYPVIENVFRSLKTSSKPVHLNIPIDEPLYELEQLLPLQHTAPKQVLCSSFNPFSISKDDSYWLNKKIIILLGQLPYNTDLNAVLETFNNWQNTTIICEETSNIQSNICIRNIDLLLPSLNKKTKQLLSCDLLISIGSHLVSKMLKQYLRNFKPKQHWHIDPYGFFPDTFTCLTKKIKGIPADILRIIVQKHKPVKSTYCDLWRENYKNISAQILLQTPEWSDIGAFLYIYNNLSPNSVLHLGNSMPIRYANFMNHRSDLEYYANRGTSGIDGSLSSAIGAASANDRQHTIILGDLSFLYDSNALWISDLPNNLKIIVLNNGGGGIFEFIPGPQRFKGFEQNFKAKHKHHFKHLALQYNIPYHIASSTCELTTLWNEFISDNSISILEINTMNVDNNEITKSYLNNVINKL